MFWNKERQQGENGWRHKATRRTLEIKALTKRNKELIKSRDFWKAKADELSVKLDEKKKAQRQTA